MGYEINYSAEDYAHAAQVCRSVCGHAEQAKQAAAQSLLHAVACRVEASWRAQLAGVIPRLGALWELSEQLEELAARASAIESLATSLAAKVVLAMERASAAEQKIRAMFVLLGAPQTLLDGFTGARENDWRPPREETQSLIELFAVLANVEILPWQARELDGPRVPEVMHKLSELLDSQNLVPRQPIGIEAVEQLDAIPLEGNLESYIQLQELTRQEDSRILIGRTFSEGREVFLVIVPGTQPQRKDDNPFDPRGILDSLGHNSENYAEAFAKALEFSGAREGSEVILSGHSQGGIHIANLAKHPLLRRKFKIKTVLTLGSPVAPIELPDDVQSLHLEDSTDPVPGMDGRPNRRKPRQLTITFPEPTNPEALDSEGFGKGHQLQNYRDHLMRLEASPGPELLPIINGLRFDSGPLKLRSFRLRRQEKKPAPTPTRRDKNYRKLSEINPPH